MQRLDTEVNNVAGDVFVAAACVAYCGAFTNTYRERVLLPAHKTTVSLIPFPFPSSPAGGQLDKPVWTPRDPDIQ